MQVNFSCLFLLLFWDMFVSQVIHTHQPCNTALGAACFPDAASTKEADADSTGTAKDGNGHFPGDSSMRDLPQDPCSCGVMGQESSRENDTENEPEKCNNEEQHPRSQNEGWGVDAQPHGSPEVSPDLTEVAAGKLNNKLKPPKAPSAQGSRNKSMQQKVRHLGLSLLLHHVGGACCPC